MAETGNQRNLTKGEKTSTSKSREDFQALRGWWRSFGSIITGIILLHMRNTTRHYILSK